MNTPNRLLLLASLVPLFLFASCGGGGGVVGTWSLDGSATLEINKDSMMEGMEGQPKEAVDMAMGMAETMFGQMKVTIDLKDGGTLTGSMKMGSQDAITMTGTWTLEGDTLTMNTKDNTGKEDTKVATVDGDRLKITDASGGGPEMVMLFTRQ